MCTGALTMRIDSRLADVALIGVAVRAICSAIPSAAEAAADVELCVVEAVNNVIEHAYREAPGHPVEVAVRIQDAVLRITVRDRGRSMDWCAVCAQADAYAADALRDGGRGVFIMRSLMDRLSYRVARGWNELTMIKRLDELEPAAAAAGR
jgi:serine/threonine-protein kinase RsbW